MDVKLSFAALAAEFADVWNDAQNPGTVQSALIDMALLSHCEDLVVTMASSFGYVAAAWGGNTTVYMVYGEHTSSQNPYWYRSAAAYISMHHSCPVQGEMTGVSLMYPRGPCPGLVSQA